MRKCTKCNIEKPITEYYKDNRVNSKSKLKSCCKECSKRAVINRSKTKIGLIAVMYNQQIHRSAN